jgi:hypothetical protein
MVFKFTLAVFLLLNLCSFSARAQTREDSAQFKVQTRDSSGLKPWVRVDNPEQGYQVDMPGNAEDLNLPGSDLHVKIYGEIFGNRFFEVGFMNYATHVPDANPDSLLQVSAQIMGTQMGTAVDSAKFIHLGKWAGIEFQGKIAEQHLYYNSRVFFVGQRLYLQMLLSTDRKRITPGDWNRFTQSLVLKEPVFDPTTRVINNDIFHFSIRMAGHPEVEISDDPKLNATTWHYKARAKGGVTYYLSSLKTTPGHFLEEDYLHDAVQTWKTSSVAADVSIMNTVWMGNPARTVEAEVSPGIYARGLFVQRGNYGYNLLVMGPEDSLHSIKVDSFFSSLQLTPLPKAEFTKQEIQPDGISLIAPPPYIGKLTGGENTDGFKCWIDNGKIEWYFLYSPTLNPAIYAASDAAWLKAMAMKLGGRILDSYSYFTFQGMPAMRFEITYRESNNAMVGVLLLRGNKLYQQSAEVLKTTMEDSSFKAFFDSLSFKDPVPPHMPWNGLDKLLDDVFSEDSLVSAKAMGALDSSAFEVGDLPLLLKRLSIPHYFAHNERHWSARNRVDAICQSLAGKDALPILANEYRNYQDRDSAFILESISNMIKLVQTKESFDTLLNLWSLKRPHFTENGPEMFIRHLAGSLPLARSIFPKIVQFQEDPLLGPNLFSYYKRLLDSGYLQIADLKPYEERLLHAAIVFSATPHWAKTDMDPIFYHMTDVLERFKDEKVSLFFQKNLHRVNLSLKFNAVSGLLYLHKAIPAEIFMTLAQSPDWRVDLYDSLGSYHKEAQFPSSFANQKAFAEAYLSSSLEDYVEGSSDVPPSFHITWIRNGIYTYQYTKSKFILFDVHIQGKAEHYLGVAGPFDQEGKSLRLSEDDLCGIYDQDALNFQKLDIQVQAYLKLISEKRKSPADEATSSTGDEEDEP